MYARSETTPVPDLGGALPTCLGSTDEQIEEYRCEITVVREKSYPANRHPSLDALPDLLWNAEGDLLEAALDSHSAGAGDGGVALWGRVHGVVIKPLLKSLAVVAAGAAHLDSDVSQVDLGPTRPLWDALLGPTWPERLTLYRSLPSATQPFDRDPYAIAVRRLAALDQRLIGDLGFNFSDDARVARFSPRAWAAHKSSRALAATSVSRRSYSTFGDWSHKVPRAALVHGE